MTTEQDEEPPIRQAIREQIDENLRRIYSATVNEELPDRFRDLLARLQAREDGRKTGSS